MKRIAKFLAVTVIAGWALSPLHADSTTTRLGLTKPDVGSTGWGPKLNTDMDQIDTNMVAKSTDSTINSGVTFTNNGISQIKGTTTNNNARSGDIGEVVRSSVGAVGLAATTTFGNITSIILSSGDWDVSGVVEFAGTTLTRNVFAISLFSGNTTTDHVLSDNVIDAPLPTAAIDGCGSLPNWRVSTASQVTVYLKAQGTYSSGSPTCRGRISARRMR